MSDIKNMLISTADRILHDHCTKKVIERAEKGLWPENLWNQLYENGMTFVGFTEEQGGMGGDVEDFLTLLKLTGYHNLPLPLAESYLANRLLTEFGESVLPEPLSVTTFPDVELPTFKENGNGWLIEGEIPPVAWGRQAEKIVLLGKAINREDYALAILTQDDIQIECGYNLANEPRDVVLGEPLKISREKVILTDNFNLELYWNLCKITKVVQMAGTLERVLDDTITYANERIQFGRPIGKFQAVKQQIAVLSGEVVASNTVADAIIKSEYLDSNTVNMAKVSLIESANKAAKIAHQVLGAMGFTNEHTLHYSTKRLWAWEYEFGGKRKLTISIGEKSLSDKNDIWDLITSS